jgi:hypothetical protein
MIFIPIAFLCLKYYQATRKAKSESDKEHASETDDLATRESDDESNSTEDDSEKRHGRNDVKSCRRDVCVPPIFPFCIPQQSRAANERTECDAMQSDCVVGHVTLQAM